MRVEFYGCLTGILYNLEVKAIIFYGSFHLSKLEQSTVELIKQRLAV